MCDLASLCKLKKYITFFKFVQDMQKKEALELTIV